MKIPPQKNLASPSPPSLSASSRPGQPSSSGLPALTPGQLLQARVLSSGRDGLVTLDVGGQKLAARSFVPLEVDRTLWLEVRQPGPPPWLAPAEQKGMACELLRVLVEARQAAPQLLPHLQALRAMAVEQGGQARPELTRLITLLESLSLGNEPAPERVALLLAWLESGRRGEKPTLPASLAQEINTLVTAFGRKGKPAPAGAGEHLQALERSARLFEALAAGNTASDGRQEWFLYPCLFAGRAGSGEWFVELPGRGETGGQPETFSLSFFLAMSRLGEVALQVTAGPQGLRGVFKVSSEDVRRHLEEGVPELSRALETVGFGSVVFTSVVAQVSHLQELRDKLQEKTANQAFSLVSVRV